MKPRAVYICGPTAIGKSAVAMALARRLNGEIISVDSMQVYRGMDIGTAKPTPEERAGIQHHVIDVAEITETFDAARFVAMAKAAEMDIHERRKLAIYCGGTGFYFNAFLQGLDGPASDPKIRAELEQIPLPVLLAELQAKDPAMFDEIDRQNPRRVIRAIEVIRLTGKPFSAQRIAWKQIEANGPLVALEMDREDLYKRIEERVDLMFIRGLIEETQHLLTLGLEKNRTAKEALGYKQVRMLLRGGLLTRAEAIGMVKTATRHFAKRQLTWFRNQLPCEWLEVKPDDSPDEIARQLIYKHKLV